MAATKVRVCILRTAGTNCDRETAFAFKHHGAHCELRHVNEIVADRKLLHGYHVLAIPGGFTYGDDIESGRILANELNAFLKDEIKRFIKDGKLVIGICNGFQVLTKAGILPGNGADNTQAATLYNNDSGKFEDRWVHLKVAGKGPWLTGMKDIVFFPVAHAEGKFVTAEKESLKDLISAKQVAFSYVNKDGGKPKYPENPNGSLEDIAGITDKTGRVLGLMPHPERHFLFVHHPHWTRLTKKEKYGDGAKIFENGVKYIKSKLL